MADDDIDQEMKRRERIRKTIAPGLADENLDNPKPKSLYQRVRDSINKVTSPAGDDVENDTVEAKEKKKLQKQALAGKS